MRRLRAWITVLLVIVPLVVLGVWADHFVRGLIAYLNTGARLAGTLSAEATRLLGREVTVGNVHVTGDLFSIASTNSVQLSDVNIAENVRPPYGRLAHVDDIRLRYSLSQILFPTQPNTPYLDEVQLIGPAVTVRRDAKGQWNFAPFLKLIKPSKPAARPAINRIAFTNGTLNYQDYAFPHPPGVPARPFVTRLTNANGNVFLNANHSTTVDIAAVTEPNIAQNLHVVGLIGAGAKQVDAWLTANRLNLPTLAARFLPPNKAVISSGLADVDVGVLYVAGAPGHLSAANLQGLRGNITVSDLTASGPLLGTPVQHVDATATVGREALTLNAKGLYAGATVQAVGSLLGYPWLSGGKKSGATISLQGSVQDMNIGRVVRAVPTAALTALPPNFRAVTRRATGQGNLDFRVSGPLTNPVATLTGHFPDIQYMGFRSHDLNVHALYSDHLIRADLRGRYGGGDAYVRAQVVPDKLGAFEIEGHGRGLHLGQVGIPVKEPIGGTANVDILMKGQHGRTPLYSAQAQVFNVKFHNETFARAYARAETRGRELVIRTLRVEDPKAYAQATGTVDLRNYALNINVDADELNLGALMGALHAPSAKSAFSTLIPSNAPTPFGPPAPGTETPLVEGFAYVRGKLTGTLSKPLLNAHVDAFAVETGKIGFDRVAANLDLTRNALVISQGTARHYLGQVRFAGVGAEPFSPNATLRLNVSADNLDIADLLRTAGVNLQNLAVTGTVSTSNILIAGKPSSLQIASPFTATFDGLTINGQQVTDASLVADYGPKGLDILHAGMQVAGGTLSASGLIAKNGQIDLTAQGRGFNLATAQTLLPTELNAALAGTLDFTASATGTMSAPHLQVQTTAQNLAVNTVPVGTLQATATYADKRAQLRDVTLSGSPAAPGEKITLSTLTYDPATKQITGAANWSHIPLQQVRQLAQASFDTTTEAGRKAAESLNQYTGSIGGDLSGSLTLSGTTDNPDVALHFNADTIRIANYPSLTLTGAANLNKTRALVPNIRLSSPEANLVIDATGVQVEYNGDMRADVSAYNVDLSLIQRLFLQRLNLPTELIQRPLTGIGDIGLLVSGKTKSPVVELSVNLRNVSFAPAAAAALPSVPPVTSAGPAPTATVAVSPTPNDAVIDHIDLYDATVKEGSISGSLRIVKNGTIDNKPIQLDLRAVGSIGFTWKPPYVPEDAPLDVQIGGVNQAALNLPFPALSLLLRTALLNSGTAQAAPVNPLGDSEGSLTLAAHVSGTRLHPRFAGSVTVAASRLHVAGFDTGLSDVNLALELQGNQVTVGPNFHAQTQVYVNGKPDPKFVGSPIVLAGSLPLGFGREGRPPSGPGITLTADSMPFLQTPLPGTTSGGAQGVAQANLRITGSVREPTLAGTLLVRDTTVTLPSNFAAAAGAPLLLPISPHFDLHVRIGNNVRLSNPLLSARIDGDIAFAGTIANPHIQGALTIEEGSFKLPTVGSLNKPFTILPPGTLRMVYPVYEEGLANLPTLQLTIDMRAQTQITATSISGVRKNYLVTVTARGPVLGAATDPVTGAPRLALNFQTEPPDLATNQQELVQRLAGVIGGADVFSQLGRNPGEALAAGLTNVFTNTVMPGLFEGLAKSTGFEEITLGQDPIQQLDVTLSRRLFGPLYVTYIRSLTGVQNYYDVKFSLRFKQRYQLSYEFTNYDINTQTARQQILLEGVWNF